MLNTLTLKGALDGLKGKKFSSEELTIACLNRIKQADKNINAFVTVVEEEALASARNADKLILSDPSIFKTKELLGVPFGVKDNFSTQGLRTTASSKVLANYSPPFDSTVVKRLKDAGVVIIGKTNMDAWAHGSSTETSDFGPTKNPWNTNHLPGGSSGGSAAAVAAHEAIASIGSETAGSIRQPAAWCGVVGLKPTYGRVSRYGIIAMGSSLDSPGPITKNVEDSALVLQVIAGKDHFDATTSPLPVVRYTLPVEATLENVKIGLSEEYFIEGIDNEVKETVMKAIRQLEDLGAEIVKIKLFDPRYAIDVYTIIQRSEVSSNLARYDGIRYGSPRNAFGDEAKRRIMLGTYALSSGYYDQYYNKASKVRTLIIDDFKKAFEKVDLIVGPTSPSLPLPLGASKESSMFGELADVLVEPSSIAGLCGINIPVGFSKSNLPIGMQLIGPQFAEEKVLSAAHTYELSTTDESWRKNTPNI